MPPEIGIFTTVMYQIVQAVTLGLGSLTGDIKQLFGFCISMAWSLGVIFWLWNGAPAMIGGMMKMLTKIFAVGWVLGLLPGNWYTLANDAVSVGETIFPEGGELDASNPSSAFWFFWEIAEFILVRIRDLVWDWKFFLNIPDLLIYIPSWLAVVGAGAVMVVVLFIAWVELAVMMIPVIICAATAVFSPIAPLAEKGLGYFLGAMVRLIGYGSLVGVLGLAVSTLKFAEGIVVSKYQALGVGVMCAIILVLALVISKVSSRIGGGIDLGQALSAIWRSGAAGGKAALSASGMVAAAAAAVTGGASAALAATSAAMQSVSSRTAGSSTAGASGGAASGAAGSSGATSGAPGGSGGSGGSSGGAWMGTLQQSGVDPGGFSPQQGQAAAAAINSEAQHRAATGDNNPISAQTAQWIASAANSPATSSQSARLSAMGIDSSNMTKWEAAQQLRNNQSKGTA